MCARMLNKKALAYLLKEGELREHVGGLLLVARRGDRDRQAVTERVAGLRELPPQQVQLRRREGRVRMELAKLQEKRHHRGGADSLRHGASAMSATEFLSVVVRGSSMERGG